MVAGTWTRTHDLLTKFLEDFYNLLSFSMLKVLARHLNFQTVTFCVTPIFVSFHRHQIWWKNNFILIWLLSFSFYLEQKKCFLTLKTKNAISSNIESNADGFHHRRDLPTKVSGDTGKNNFFIFEQIPRLSRFRSRSEPSIGVREPPENTEIKSGLLDFFSFRLWRWDNLWESLLNRFQVNFGMQSRILSPSPSLHCETMAWFNEAASDL